MGGTHLLDRSEDLYCFSVLTCLSRLLPPCFTTCVQTHRSCRPLQLCAVVCLGWRALRLSLGQGLYVLLLLPCLCCRLACTSTGSVTTCSLLHALR